MRAVEVVHGGWRAGVEAAAARRENWEMEVSGRISANGDKVCEVPSCQHQKRDPWKVKNGTRKWKTGWELVTCDDEQGTLENLAVTGQV